MGYDKKPPANQRNHAWTPWGPQPVQKRVETVSAVRRMAKRISRIGKGGPPRLAPQK